MDTQRPKVNDIVKIYCSDIDMSYYYGRVTEVKSLGIVVDTLSSIGKAYFSFAANCIVVVGHEELNRKEGWAYVGNVEAERPQEMTLKDLRRIKKKLEQCSLKPYKGYYGFGPQGLFEIKNDEQLARLKKAERT